MNAKWLYLLCSLIFLRTFSLSLLNILTLIQHSGKMSIYCIQQPTDDVQGRCYHRTSGHVVEWCKGKHHPQVVCNNNSSPWLASDNTDTVKYCILGKCLQNIAKYTCTLNGLLIVVKSMHAIVCLPLLLCALFYLLMSRSNLFLEQASTKQWR